MDRETVAITRAFAQRLSKAFRLDRLMLFGSRARGDNFVTSDFDFIVVSTDFEGVPIPERMSRVYELWTESRDIDALCYTPDEFERAAKDVTLVRLALREGTDLMLKSKLR